MQIWHFHPDTGVLIGAGSADPNPLQPGGWLIPAFATPVAPPEPGEGEMVVWVAGEWQIGAVPTPPPPPLPEPAQPPQVPSEVTNFQARALLMGMPGSAEGRTLFQDVDDALRALGGVPWQAWEYTTTIPRQSALVAALAAQFDLTEAALDDMFRAAAQISV
jgi:hypothetical protein